MDPYVGEIRLLAIGYVPVGWHDCDGSLLPISDNEILFQLLGTSFGGDGVNTFSLPDMRGRVPVHNGAGPQLSTYVLGQTGGSPSVTLAPQQLPSHSHPYYATTAAATTGTPSSAVELGSISGDALYTDNIENLQVRTVANTMIGPAPTGSAQPHENHMPTLTMRFCISLYGVYPSQ
jgi:microcystin-dependent protein